MGKNRVKTIDVSARRAKLVEYRRQKRQYRDFYQELGYSSVGDASKDFNRVLKENLTAVKTGVELYREIALLELEDLSAKALTVMHAEHYVVGSGGRVAIDPATGSPVIDHGPNLAAIDRLLRIQDRQAKLLGLDAATKVDVTGEVKYEIVGIASEDLG